MTNLTASVQFHELAQGYRSAAPDGAQAAYEKLCAFLEGRAAPVAESVPTHDAWKRPIYYTDTINARQVCRDDLWAVTTDELHALDSFAARASAPSAEMVSLEDLCALLPGPYYMDPPDGGDTPVMEQLRRMAEDADKYRASAPSVDRNSAERAKALNEAWHICVAQADKARSSSGAARAMACADAIHRLAAMPQPVDAAQAVPEDLFEEMVEQGYTAFCESADEWRADPEASASSGRASFAVALRAALALAAAPVAQPTDTTKAA